MRVEYKQERVKCSNVVVESGSVVQHLTGDSYESLVENGAFVSGGFMRNSTVSGKVALVDCETVNATVTGEGALIGQRVTGKVRLERIPRKRTPIPKPIPLFEYTEAKKNGCET